jgi:tRNA nucleotidyltransferase (CCA-adding enzyme)
MDLAPLLSGHSKLFEVQQVLTRAGFLAWLAGGCVRDALLGREPVDFDLVTDASVDDVRKLFPKTVLVGEQFGVLRVLHEGEEFEVAQFRKESDYKDGRRPSLVESATPEEDAFRRDLTVNALFYDPSKQNLHDYVGGLQDLKDRRLRAVGDAHVRFREDHLRILRAVRFKAQLNFEWDPSLEQAIRREVGLLSKVSRERIRDEIMKMTRASHWLLLPEFLVESGILSALFPKTQWKANAHWPLSFPSEAAVWWEWGLWCLRSGNAFESALDVLSSLKLSRSELRSCEHFLFWFAESEEWMQLHLGALVEKTFEEGGREGLLTWLGLHPDVFLEKDKLLDLVRKYPSAPEPWIKASDLPAWRGPELGRKLKEAYHRQLSGEDPSREQALRRFGPASSSSN